MKNQSMTSQTTRENKTFNENESLTSSVKCRSNQLTKKNTSRTEGQSKLE